MLFKIIIGLWVIFAVLGIIFGIKLYGLKRKKEQIKWIWIFSENKKDKGNECGIGNNYNPNAINWNYCYK